MGQEEKVFDEKYSKGQPNSFSVGQAEVVECLDKGVQQIPIGAKAQIECPSSMGYGEVEKPNVPADSDLLFDVELLACENDELAELDQT